MSIALNARIKEMERRLEELEAYDKANREIFRLLDSELSSLQERLTALENRPKPGRPPKNG